MKKEYDFSNGRRGALIPQTGKTRISIYIEDGLLEEFRDRSDACGYGYQDMMDEAFRNYLHGSGQPVDAETLRRILREEIARARWPGAQGGPTGEGEQQ